MDFYQLVLNRLKSELSTPRTIADAEDNVQPEKTVSPPIIQPTTGACHILNLPHELVFEVASWVVHPADILSLSFTSKYFYLILIKTEGHDSTWRRSRQTFKVISSINIMPVNSSSLNEGEEFGAVRLQWVEESIPAPYEGMREVELVWILFGPKACMTCAKTFNETPKVIGLGTFLCKQCGSFESFTITENDARTEFTQNHGTAFDFEALWKSTPRVKTPLQTYDLDYMLYHPHPIVSNDRAGRLAWDTVVASWKSSPNGRRFKEERTRLHPLMENRMNTSSILNEWLNKYQKHVGNMHSAFKASAEIFARTHGVELQDVQNASPFRHLNAIANRSRITDLRDLLTPDNTAQILHETSKINHNRINRTASKAITTRRTDISSLYATHSFVGGIKPTLQTFREIPILKALQNSYAPAGMKPEKSGHEFYHPYHGYNYGHNAGDVVSDKISIASALKGRGFVDLVDVGVAKWRVGAVQGARALLGYQERSGRKKRKRGKKGNEEMEVDVKQEQEGVDTKAEEISPGLPVTDAMEVDIKPTNNSTTTISGKTWTSTPNVVDPEMRLTAWFKCTKCLALDPAYKRMRVLDFKGICAHACVQSDKKKRDQTGWSINNFVLAPRAIDTTKKMLEILGLDETNPKTTRSSLDGWWVCENCPSTVRAMIWEDLIRHCLRHPTQSISKIATTEEADRRAKLPDSRKAPWTFADLLTGKHEDEVMEEQFGCCHCHSSILGRNIGVEGVGKDMKMRAMKFHGMRQHIKAKHGIEDVRNEDYYWLAEGLFKRTESSVNPIKPTPKEKDKAKKQDKAKTEAKPKPKEPKYKAHV